MGFRFFIFPLTCFNQSREEEGSSGDVGGQWMLMASWPAMSKADGGVTSRARQRQGRASPGEEEDAGRGWAAMAATRGRLSLIHI